MCSQNPDLALRASIGVTTTIAFQDLGFVTMTMTVGTILMSGTAVSWEKPPPIYSFSSYFFFDCVKNCTLILYYLSNHMVFKTTFYDSNNTWWITLSPSWHFFFLVEYEVSLRNASHTESNINRICLKMLRWIYHIFFRLLWELQSIYIFFSS